METLARTTLAAVLVAVVGCHPRVRPPASGPVPLFEDLGNHQHPVTTRVPAAQRYFDQGLRLVYAFNHAEAIRAFEEAARLDPHCAMAHWGVALALGPNINLPMDAPAEARAAGEIARARALAPRASPAERDYIETLAVRYAPEGGDVAARQVAYADAMRELAHRHPEDLDAATLFAEALLDLRPWGQWTPTGDPAPGTIEAVETLEGVLARDPNHPGANHYYIHAVEGSRHPERALDAAERLPRLVPGAGHLVHMPSHVYMRVGRYADASAANERAIAVDRAYFARVKPTGVYPLMYATHNVQFLWAARSMEGRSAAALAAAREAAAAATPDVVRDMPMAEAVAVLPLCTLVRFGRWNDVLQEPAPGDDYVYTTAIWHYARGFAHAARGEIADARREAAEVHARLAAMPADRPLGVNNAKPVLAVAAATLDGEIAARAHRPGEAIRQLEAAVRLQDSLTYDEPPPWYYPVRQSLAAVLLEFGYPPAAEAVYREDLRRNPENGWSLFGLAQSLRVQGHRADADAVEARQREAWSGADVTLVASRF